MSSPYYSFFRRRTIGRAASPPTWACYEQIPYDDDDDECSDSGSEQESCSEDAEDYAQPAHDTDSDREEEHVVHTSEKSDNPTGPDIDMEIDAETTEGGAVKKSVDFQKDVKGKQRAIETQSDNPKKRRVKKRRERVYTLRPILTIQRSQGFVWNQVSSMLSPHSNDSFTFDITAPGPVCSALHQRQMFVVFTLCPQIVRFQ
jgi:hypothetical protein